MVVGGCSRDRLRNADLQLMQGTPCGVTQRSQWRVPRACPREAHEHIAEKCLVLLPAVLTGGLGKGTVFLKDAQCFGGEKNGEMG